MERYESLGPVGEGSYGSVLKCRHRESGRLVAIKKFIDSDDDKTVKKIALREIKLLRQLHHDNLVNLLEVWKRRRRWYLVFEFVDRTLLDELEQNSSGLDLHTCRQYLFQILRAANFCHQQNVIHRDIKPENILVSQGGVVKLCDFGFARTIASSSEGGVYTDYVATRWYRAPELLVGDIKYGKPVDVWALGCVLMEMLTGQALFPGDSDLDQIYHIVKCFGNLTAHHQELFYRNPIFSGVKLPECSKTVPLQQRFPRIPPTALDLAQDCLEMDPKRRAQCSDLLEHLLFTQDSFNIRFLDELNTEIQKDHREKSSFPKIPKTPMQERENGDDKNCRSKDKKEPEEMEEKVYHEKMEKTKGRQPAKLSTTIHNTTEPFMSKQPKTCSNKGVYHTEQYLMKAGKPAGSEFENLRSIYICSSDSSDTTKKSVSLKKKSSVAAKPKHEQDITQDPRKDYLHKSKDLNYSNLDSGNTTMPFGESSKSETNKEFVRSLSNISSKVPKLSKMSVNDRQILNSSSKTVLESDSSVIPTNPPSSNEYTARTLLEITKPGRASLASKFQSEKLEADVKQETCECPKAQPKNQRRTHADSSIIQPSHNDCSFSPSRTAVDLSKQSFVTVPEPGTAHAPSALPQVISHSKVPKTTCTAKDSSKDKGPTEDRDIKNGHRYLKLNPMTEIPRKPCLSSHVLDRNPEISKPYFTCPQSNIITAEERNTSTPGPDENLPVEKELGVSAKLIQEDSALSVPISLKANAPMNKTSKPSERSAKGKWNNASQEFQFDSKALTLSYHYPNPTMAQSVSDHMMSSVKNPIPIFTPDAKKQNSKLEGNVTNMSTDLVVSLDHKALTRSLILHDTDSKENMFDYTVLGSCTPSAP
ncbi:cyclin-dependent kinase-like 5, partial [Cyprinodon tularosa]|uniref:cyclin-dependent kinase-like 5 n=1 Tax=Cyprinodon tularosa TaxID=77115 RepID=UPI0018E21B7E